MAYLFTFTQGLPSRQSFTLFDPADDTNKWAALLNPRTVSRTTGSVRKYTMTTNGSAVILGGQEYPPKEISIAWTQITESELILMSAFTNMAPVALVDNNNRGHLGVFCIDTQEQLGDVSKLVYAVKASFLVIAPYNGIGTTIPALTPPTIVAAASSVPGYFPAGQTTHVYLWATVFTPSGESTVGAMTTVTSTNQTNAFTINFTAPTSKYYRKTRLYWNSSPDPTSATMLTDILAGFPLDGSPSFTLYAPYVSYNALNPPLYSTAFTGQWLGGFWAPGT